MATQNHKRSAILLTTLVVGGMLAGCAVKGVEPSASEVPLMRVAAQGVQIYECRAVQGGMPAWAFVAPEADLFDGSGRLIGRHGAGPFWRHEDGSGFTGSVLSRADAPRAHAIPWLLLAAKTEGGRSGAFERVSSVQRLNTVGGVAPGSGCTASTLGQQVRMAYRADYVMFAPRLSMAARL